MTILESEVEMELKHSKRKKAAGIDGITTEMLLACETIAITWLTRIFNIAWEAQEVPDNWQRAIIVPIWKSKVDKRECETYRGIYLLSHTGKNVCKNIGARSKTDIRTTVKQ